MNTIKNLKTLFIIVIALLGCDTVIELENQSPQVEVTSLCISDGRVYIDLMVTDVDEDPVDVALRVADPGAIEGLSTNVDSTGLVAAGPEADGLLGAGCTRRRKVVSPNAWRPRGSLLGGS